MREDIKIWLKQLVTYTSMLAALNLRTGCQATGKTGLVLLNPGSIPRRISPDIKRRRNTYDTVSMPWYVRDHGKE